MKTLHLLFLLLVSTIASGTNQIGNVHVIGGIHKTTLPVNKFSIKASKKLLYNITTMLQSKKISHNIRASNIDQQQPVLNFLNHMIGKMNTNEILDQIEIYLSDFKVTDEQGDIKPSFSTTTLNAMLKKIEEQANSNTT